MAIANAFYTEEFHGPFELHALGDFALEEGGVLPDLQRAVSTQGTLNAARDNCILVPTWYSGTHQIMEQVYIGPDRVLNPDEYFIVAVNQIGNGLSTSPHNVDGPHAGPGFPKVTVGDDVRAQEQLLREAFGVEELALVVGGSMGAQQTWEWAVRFPDQVKRAAPIAGTARTTHHDALYTQNLMDAIMSDPGWNGGAYASAEEVAEGLVDRVVQAGWLAADGRLPHLRGLHRRVHARLPRGAGPQLAADDGVEVAARRRRAQRGRLARRRARAHQGEGLRDADLGGHVLPTA